jgi:hypothetical protein
MKNSTEKKLFRRGGMFLFIYFFIFFYTGYLIYDKVQCKFGVRFTVEQSTFMKNAAFLNVTSCGYVAHIVARVHGALLPKE